MFFKDFVFLAFTVSFDTPILYCRFSINSKLITEKEPESFNSLREKFSDQFCIDVAIYNL